MEFDILHQDHPDRGEVIDYIHRKFAQAYNADVKTFMPNFIRVRYSKDAYKSVMGYRDAANHKLYLENYLDDPIEEVIGRYIGQPVDRSSIVEVGNMVEDQPGDARLAIITATAYFHSVGYRWVVFTGVGKLRNAFRRLGLNPLELMEADDSRLSDEERKSWGTYYKGRPVICFGDIQSGYTNLQELWSMLRATWSSAVKQGEMKRRDEEPKA